MRKRLQVFISSTYKDLIEERQAAVEAILNAGHIPAGMELFKSSNETQLETIKRWIDESDIYLLILGGRYGSIEPNSEKSYTQLEYEYAVEKKLPLFSIVIKEEALDDKVRIIGKEVLELANQQKYNEFKQNVLSRVSSFFRDSKDIKYIISDTISDFERRFKFTGWVSGKDVLSLENELKSIRAKLKKQEDELSQFRSNNTAFIITNPDTQNNINKYNLGEVAKYKGLDICVNQIEYKTDGFRIYFSITNNTNHMLDSFGGFTFKLKQEIYEEEVNGLGYGIHATIPIKSYYLYPKESFNGYYEWRTFCKVEIEEVAYRIMKSGIKYDYAGIWTA